MTCVNPGQIAHDRLEAIERSAAGVRLVALHQRAPLCRRHRTGTRVGQQVDEHVIRMEQEDVPASRLQRAPRVPRRSVKRMASTDLMRNGSMMVWKDMMGHGDMGT